MVLINRRNGPRYQCVLALCAFFNRGNTEGTNSSGKKMKFVYGLSLFVYGLIFLFCFLKEKSVLMTCVQIELETDFNPHVIRCG